MIDEKVGYGYSDLKIVPCVITDIDHRSECNSRDKNGMLPLKASPMCTVSNENNYDVWVKNGIYACYPRTVKYSVRVEKMLKGCEVALSKKEFIDLFITNAEYIYLNNVYNVDTFKVIIDTANGHCKSIYTNIDKAKKIANKHNMNLYVTAGNVANPAAYRWLCENSTVDAVRLAIGSGKACITTPQTSVHYPIASLIDECRKIKNEYEYPDEPEYGGFKHCPDIIADGGIRGYGDIILALALGADYVMIGSVFAALQESAAETVSIDGKMFKRYFGMATKEAQRLINAASKNPKPEDELKLKTSEGTSKYLELGTSVDRWVRNFEDYLKSAMSYTDCRTLEKFTDGYSVTCKVNSPAETNAVNK